MAPEEKELTRIVNQALEDIRDAEEEYEEAKENLDAYLRERGEG